MCLIAGLAALDLVVVAASGVFSGRRIQGLGSDLAERRARDVCALLTIAVAARDVPLVRQREGFT